MTEELHNPLLWPPHLAEQAAAANRAYAIARTSGDVVAWLRAVAERESIYQRIEEYQRTRRRQERRARLMAANRQRRYDATITAGKLQILQLRDGIMSDLESDVHKLEAQVAELEGSLEAIRFEVGLQLDVAGVNPTKRGILADIRALGETAAVAKARAAQVQATAPTAAPNTPPATLADPVPALAPPTAAYTMSEETMRREYSRLYAIAESRKAAVKVWSEFAKSQGFVMRRVKDKNAVQIVGPDLPKAG